MVDFKILYVYKSLAIIKIDVEIYIIRMDIPSIYNQQFQKLSTPNIDNWVQANTHQRYSFRNICDMAEAFRDGMQYSYHHDEIHRILNEGIILMRDTLFKDGFISEYSQLYWLEMIPPSKMRGYLESIGDNFENLKNKLGADRLYNHLCRVWQCTKRSNKPLLDLIERLIARLGKSPVIPQYPDTSVIDKQLNNVISRRLMDLVPIKGPTIQFISCLEAILK